jgi:hypothetical protein
MAEPTTTGGISLTVLFVAFLGPWAGPYALIAFASLAGALWPLSAQTTETRVAGAKLLLRCTLTAILLTVFLAQMMERFWSIPVNESLAPVALLIGALGNGWRPVFDAIGAALGAVVGKKIESGRNE